jgi:hypothetical protein
MHHHNLVRARSKTFVTRSSVASTIEEYFHCTTSPYPLVIYGQVAFNFSSNFILYLLFVSVKSGSGKTCVMAKTTSEAKRIFPQAVVVTRFAGNIIFFLFFVLFSCYCFFFFFFLYIYLYIFFIYLNAVYLRHFAGFK